MRQSGVIDRRKPVAPRHELDELNELFARRDVMRGWHGSREERGVTHENHHVYLEAALTMRLLCVRSNILRMASLRTGPLRIALVRLAGLLVLLLSFSLAAPVLAQDQVTLGEILPALAGSELGALAVAPAPPPGGVRVVSRAEVLAALREAGRSADGLDVPRSTRIARAGEHLDGDALTRLATPAVEEALSPCELSGLALRGEMDVPAGERTIEIDRPALLRSGAVAFTVRVEVGSYAGRVTGQAVLSCPEPVVTPGTDVTARIVIGAVRVSARGTCREAGRPGDTIRVRIEHTGGLVDARVIDASTVEVVQ
jgi:hypothetical protein